MNKKIFAVLAILASTVLLGAGCGGQQKVGPTTDSSKEEKKVLGMEDVCNYFPKELVEEAIDRPIVRAEKSMADDACFYYTEYDEGYFGGRGAGGPNVVVVFEEKNLDDAWKAEMIEKTYIVERDASIPMDNYVVKRKNGDPWQVNLIVGGGKILRFQINHKAVAGEYLVKVAARFAERINK